MILQPTISSATNKWGLVEDRKLGKLFELRVAKQIYNTMSDSNLGVEKDCPCDIDWCMSREFVNTMNTIADSELHCREGLKKCRSEKQPIVTYSSGWDSTIVLIVGSIIVVAVLGGGIAIGYAVGKL